MKFRFFVLLNLLLLILGTGCNIFSGSTRSRESKPPITTRKDPIQKGKDSLAVVKIPTETDTTTVDKVSEADPHTTLPKKDLIHIAIAIPASSGYDISRFAEFVNGVQLRSESYRTGKPQIRVKITDIGNTNEEATLLKNPTIQAADVLIGGFQTSQVKSLAAIAERKKIPYLSVWNTSSDIVSDNPYYIQLKPALETFCSEMAKYIGTSVRPQSVYLLFKSSSSRDYSTLQYYKAALEKYNIPLHQAIINDSNDEWKNQLLNSDNAAIIIPNWDDKSFISKTLSTLRSLKKNHRWTVAGMPQWSEFDQMDFGLYESLQLVIPVFNYINESAIHTGLFCNEYIQRYNTFPGNESYYGYDIMEIAVKLAKARASGKRFDPLTQINGSYHSVYNIQSNYSPAPGSESGVRATYNHNTYITIQKFEGGRFVPIR